MSVITNQIPPQSFEIVRDRIGRILADEWANQYLLSGNNADFKISQWIERFIPFDRTELAAINVSLAEGSFEWNTPIQSTGVYRYYIDVYVNAPHTDIQPGDQAAMVKLQRILGITRSILMDARYITLGYPKPPGFVWSRVVDSIQIQNPNQRKDDMEHTVMGRIVMSVKLPETTAYVQPVSLALSTTKVILTGSAKGYQWVMPGNSIYDPYDFGLDK